MKTYAYKLAALLLSPFPDRWNNKDTQGAILGFVGVLLILVAVWRLVPWFVRSFL